MVTTTSGSFGVEWPIAEPAEMSRILIKFLKHDKRKKKCVLGL
jgi:hypothetical protein